SQSRYSTLFGIPLAAWGLFFYGSLLALLAPSLFGESEEIPDAAPSLAFFLIALAVGIDILLFGLQAFVIKAFCSFCIATYFVNLVSLALLWPFKQTAQALNFLVTPRARRALVAWIVASLSVGGAAIAGDTALSGRKSLASDSILGIPTMLQAPEKIEKGSVEEQLAAATAEAKKWKDTLDDERRLQIYLNQKAKDDFNKAQVETLDLAHSPAQGATNGPIRVVSYSDFMCPFCRDLATALRNYLPSTSNRVTAYYKQFPLDTSCNAHVGQTVHPGACELAWGGVCAQESGRFWEYHDKVFAQRWDRATREDVVRIGVSAGLDASTLVSCMDAAGTKGRLAKDIDEAARVGVGSTPTLFVNGRKLQSSGVFLLAIEEERKRLNLPPLSGRPNP
ncbi:MAG: thioredoxin domain-containing protein, partial [Vicinamibacteria bacterium]|nr:thioredoxin domain-containing protein [Vicinamibacteria bacterium]